MTDAMSPTDFVAYEYVTTRVDRALEALHKDTYRNLGWIEDGYGATLPGRGVVELKFKRDRRVRERAALLGLQREADAAIASISALERSRTSVAMTVSIIVGIVGSAFLAGSVFTLQADLLIPSVVLGAVGLIGWVLGYFLYGRVRERRSRRLAPLIERQYENAYDAAERAARLLA